MIKKIFLSAFILLLTSNINAEQNLYVKAVSTEIITNYITPVSDNKNPINIKLSGYYRVNYTSLYNTEIEKTNVGPTYNNNSLNNIALIYHKMVLFSNLIVNNNINIYGEFNIFNDKPIGASAGNILTYDTSDKSPNIILRRVWGSLIYKGLELQVGRIPVKWGLGIFENNGNKIDYLFGDSHYGNTVDRVALSFKPLGSESDFKLEISLDKIIEGLSISRDNYQIINSGKDTNQLSIDILYDSNIFKFGYLFQYKVQELTKSKIYYNDLFYNLNIGVLQSGFEIISVKGETKNIYHLNSKNEITNYYNNNENTTLFDQTGWFFTIGLTSRYYSTNLNIGSASGDTMNNLVSDSDNKLTAFQFNPDFNIGMLMFEYALNSFSLNERNKQLSYIKMLSDNNLLSDNSIDYLNQLNRITTNGSITNASFVNPVIIITPNNLIRFYFGYLWATSRDERIIHISGNEIITGKIYGFETDLGADYFINENLFIQGEFGYFNPGDYFNYYSQYSREIIEPNSIFGFQLKAVYRYK